jgi:DNA modification methylase
VNIQKVKIDKINPAAYNPRKDLKPGDPDYENLKKSIHTFGYVEPLVWNKRTGNLVGGHQRFKILIEQGLNEVDVSVVELDLEKEKTLNLALNKISGDWDDEKLGILLKELTQNADFDSLLAGFDLPEISQIFDRLERINKDKFNIEDELKNNKDPKTKLGDLIELGEHRLLCGDCSQPEDLARLFGDKKVALMHTDPPYNVNYYGGNRPTANTRPKDSKQWDRIYSDDMTQEEYEAWLVKVLTNGASHLAQGATVYIWNGHRQFGPMHQILSNLKFHIGCVITWAKPSFAIGYGDYNQQTEFCLYAWKEKNGAHNWYGPNNESTLWQVKRDVLTDYVHPTQKPIELAHRAIRNSSIRGDIVLDMFLGSGTTLIAAESLKRRCFGTEISPGYCDAIVKRYAAYAGKEKVSKEILAKYGIE